MAKARVDIKASFPLKIDGQEFDTLRAAVDAKHPAGLAGYQTVYSRVQSGWPLYHAILLPSRPKEG